MRRVGMDALPRGAAPARGGEAGAALSPAALQRAVLAGLMQMLVIGGIGGASYALARSGLGTPARLVFLLAGLAAAAWYIRRSPWEYLTFSFWLWTLAPFFRRLVDYHAGFDPTSVMLAAPSAATIFMLKPVLQSPGLLSTQEGRIGLLLAVPLFYGMSVNLVTGEVLPGAVAAADWLAPLLYYFYLLSVADRIEKAEPHFRIFLTLNLLVMVGYGLQQFFAPNDWDNVWIQDSGLVELGGPLPYTIRIFGTLNTPGPLATWISTVLLLALHFRTRLMLPLLPAAGVLLLLTLVRGCLGTLALGLCGAILLGRARVAMRVVKSVLLMALVMGTIGTQFLLSDPEMTERVAKRFDTFNELEYDVSAEDRLRTYLAAPALIDESPFGQGIAVLGRGAVAAGEGQVVIDAGPVAIYVALGWIGGTVYLVGIAAVLLRTLAGARAAGSSAALATAAAALANISGLVFSNAMGVQAAILWFCVGYANALALAARRGAQAAEGRRASGPGLSPQPLGIVPRAGREAPR